jgi:hypothetical protein
MDFNPLIQWPNYKEGVKSKSKTLLLQQSLSLLLNSKIRYNYSIIKIN